MNALHWEVMTYFAILVRGLVQRPQFSEGTFAVFAFLHFG